MFKICLNFLLTKSEEKNLTDKVIESIQDFFLRSDIFIDRKKKNKRKKTFRMQNVFKMILIGIFVNYGSNLVYYFFDFSFLINF